VERTSTVLTVNSRGEEVLLLCPRVRFDELTARTQAEITAHAFCQYCSRALSAPFHRCEHCGNRPSPAGIPLPSAVATRILRRERRQALGKGEARREHTQEAPGLCPVEAREAIARTQDHRCYFCRDSFAARSRQWDHLTPLAQGGSFWPSNLALVCAECNSLKGNRSARSYLAVLRKTLSAEALGDLRTRLTQERRLKRALDRDAREEASRLARRWAEAVARRALAGAGLDRAPASDAIVRYDDDGLILALAGRTFREPAGIIRHPHALQAAAERIVRALA
jgi:5-methylcytosine-specific restriction endonuclease McrA